MLRQHTPHVDLCVAAMGGPCTQFFMDTAAGPLRLGAQCNFSVIA